MYIWSRRRRTKKRAKIEMSRERKNCEERISREKTKQERGRARMEET